MQVLMDAACYLTGIYFGSNSVWPPDCKSDNWQGYPSGCQRANRRNKRNARRRLLGRGGNRTIRYFQGCCGSLAGTDIYAPMFGSKYWLQSRLCLDIIIPFFFWNAIRKERFVCEAGPEAHPLQAGRLVCYGRCGG